MTKKLLILPCLQFRSHSSSEANRSGSEVLLSSKILHENQNTSSPKRQLILPFLTRTLLPGLLLRFWFVGPYYGLSSYVVLPDLRSSHHILPWVWPPWTEKKQEKKTHAVECHGTDACRCCSGRRGRNCCFYCCCCFQLPLRNEIILTQEGNSAHYAQVTALHLLLPLLTGIQ